MASLVDLQDQLNVARNFLACIYMACQSPLFPGDERRTLCAVLDAAREHLSAVGAGLDALIEAEMTSEATKAGPAAMLP